MDVHVQIKIINVKLMCIRFENTHLEYAVDKIIGTVVVGAIVGIFVGLSVSAQIVLIVIGSIFA